MFRIRRVRKSNAVILMIFSTPNPPLLHEREKDPAHGEVVMGGHTLQ